VSVKSALSRLGRRGYPVSVPVAVFLVLSLSYFGVPGLILDNLEDENAGFRIAQAFKTFDLPQLAQIFSSGYPLHHGSLTSYLMAPFFFVFGPSFTLVRSWPVVCGIPTLLLTYVLVKRTINRKVAVLTFLLAFHPSFVGGVRIGNMLVSYMLLFIMGSLLCWHAWHLTSKTRFLAFGFFLAGLGLGTRLWFAFYLAAVGAAAFVWKLSGRMGGTAANPRIPEGRFLALSAAGASFILGLAPILIHEFQGFPSFGSVADRFASFGAGDKPFFAGLDSMLSGHWIFFVQFHGLPSFRNPVYTPLVLIATVWSVGRLFFKPAPSRSERNLAWFRVFFSFLYALLSLKSPLGHPSYFILYPFALILVSGWIWRIGKHFRKSLFVPAAILALLGVFELRTLALYLYYTGKAGGLGVYSNSIHDLSRWLQAHPDPDIFAADREIGENLLFLTSSSRLVPGIRYTNEMFLSLSSPPAPGTVVTSVEKTWEEAMAGRKEVFVVLSAIYPWSSYISRLFLDWAGSRVVLRRRFFDHDGKETFQVYLWR
jgi:hypothetical protein